MPKEKTLFVQGDSSEDDDVSLVKPRKMAASAPKAPKGHLSESEGDNIPLTQRYPKSKAKTSVPAKQKRKASPPAEPVAQKRSKKDRTSDSNTARKKKAAAEISRRCFRHPCSPKDHKTKRFDSAVASLLLDSVSHPLFASHVSQALDTCRIGKTESEKLHEVLDAVRVQATEYQCSDEATNTAIANVRRTWMKQQAATIATEVTDSTDLLTLFQGLIARVDGTGASELKDPKRTHGLCKRVTKAFDRPASKRSSTNTQDAGEAGATQDAEVNIIEPETTTPRCETAIPDTTVTTVEAPVTSEPPSIANEVKRATMCLMACQSSQSFWSLNTRAMIERLIELFHTPQDLFVAYVMRHMQELAVAAGLEVNNVANYQEAVDRWEGLNEPRQNTWKKDDFDVVKPLLRLQNPLIPPQPGKAQPGRPPAWERQDDNNGNRPQTWNGAVLSRPSPHAQSPVFGHPSMGYRPGIEGGQREVNEQGGGGLGRSFLFDPPSGPAADRQRGASYGGRG